MQRRTGGAVLAAAAAAAIAGVLPMASALAQKAPSEPGRPARVSPARLILPALSYASTLRIAATFAPGGRGPGGGAPVVRARVTLFGETDPSSGEPGVVTVADPFEVQLDVGPMQAGEYAFAEQINLSTFWPPSLLTAVYQQASVSLLVNQDGSLGASVGVTPQAIGLASFDAYVVSLPGPTSVEASP